MLNKIGALSACGLLAAVLAGPSAAEAAVVIYSGYDMAATGPASMPNSNAARAAYMAAIAGLSDTFATGFEDAAAGPFASYDLGGGGVMTGALVNGEPQTMRKALQCPFALCGGNTTAGGVTYVGVSGGKITFTFAAPIQAFGAYFTGPQMDGLTLTFNDGSAQTVGVPGFQGADFVGFTDFGRSITQVTFNAGRDIMALDDVTFTLAPTAAVPEPATWAMMIAGFGLAGASLRRRRAMAV